MDDSPLVAVAAWSANASEETPKKEAVRVNAVIVFAIEVVMSFLPVVEWIVPPVLRGSSGWGVNSPGRG
jgi:hypothetical protein